MVEIPITLRLSEPELRLKQITLQNELGEIMYRLTPDFDKGPERIVEEPSDILQSQEIFKSEESPMVDEQYTMGKLRNPPKGICLGIPLRKVK